MSEEKIEENKPINHPYMQTLQGTLEVHKKLLSCLEKRIAIIGQNASSLTEYDLNENEITKIKTIGEIDILKRIIREKEQYFIKFMHQFVAEVEDLEKNYDSVLRKAKTSKNDAIRHILYSAKWDTIESNIEVKLALYKRLKKMLK